LANDAPGFACQTAFAPAPAAHFVPKSGTPKCYVKTVESANKRRQVFCGTCGTHIYARAIEDPQSYTLRAGAITRHGAFSPRRQIWRRSALEWVEELAKVPSSEKS
jgi:hypothetical protein